METQSKKRMKVAIVHDFLTYWGGAEQVLLSLHNLYRDAPIYTLLYDECMQKFFPNAKIRPSFLNKLPGFLKRRKRLLLPLFPAAAESFDLGDFDLVISSSSSFAKGIVIRPKTVHIDYCHAPTRFLWDYFYDYLKENRVSSIKKIFVVPVLHLMRMWDLGASERVDFFIANSKCTADKIRKFYRKESVVIYPPVDFEKLTSLTDKNHSGEKDYYLIVSRLSPYKKIDLAISALSRMNLPLIIIGEGSDRIRLEGMAGQSVKFLGWQDEESLANYYRHARALIFPGEDDFGITILEAMSFGKPVLAYKKGGALETVKPGMSGELFESQVPEILADGIRRLNKNYANYDPEKIKAYAKTFSRENFERNLSEFIEKTLNQSR